MVFVTRALLCRFLDDDGEMARFIQQHAAMLTFTPSHIYALAANSRDKAAIKASIRYSDSGMGRPPWIKWLNPDTDHFVANKWSLKVHGDAVAAVAIDGQIAATAGSNGSAKVWELSSGAMLYELPQFQPKITCMALSVARPHVAVADADGHLRMWALSGLEAQRAAADGLRTKTLRLPETPDFGVLAHQSAIAAVAFLDGADLVCSVGRDAMIKVWSISSVSVVRVIDTGHTGAINCVRALREKTKPARKPVAGAQHLVFTCSADTTVKMWDVAAKAPEVRQYKGHTSPVNCVQVCSKANLVASCGQDLTCRVWRIEDGVSVAVIQHDAPLSYVAIDHASDTVITICHQVYMLKRFAAAHVALLS
jgi:WD40 repeat protein